MCHGPACTVHGNECLALSWGWAKLVCREWSVWEFGLGHGLLEYRKGTEGFLRITNLLFQLVVRVARRVSWTDGLGGGEGQSCEAPAFAVGERVLGLDRLVSQIVTGEG